MTASISWSPEERQALEQAAAAFKAYTATEAYRTDLNDRQERKRFFQQELPERLPQLSEADVEEIVGLLWSHMMWGNKAYVAQQIVAENGLERVRENLRLLYAQQADPEDAYDRFLSSVKRWGPASVTEMLAYIYPRRCGIWNKQARTALALLGLTDRVDVSKYRLSKEEYRRLNALLQAIADELRRRGFDDVDLLIVDFFLYHVVSSRAKSDETAGDEVAGDFDHDEIRDAIAQIGSNLGFDTKTEVQIARGARVDVVWTTHIANLGMITYVFEVHRAGSIDSLILNLQKGLNNPTVQKVIAVSNQKHLQQIKAESETLPEQFRRALRLWDVAEVIRVSRALEQAMTLISKLDLQTKEASWS